MNGGHEAEGKCRERARLEEFQAEFLRREVEFLTRRHHQMVYSAAWWLARPLHALELWIKRAVRIVGVGKRQSEAARLEQNEASQIKPRIAASTGSRVRLDTEAPSRLLIDVSTIVKSDGKTGIQRVVRNIVRSLYAAGDAKVTPVAVRRVGEVLWTCNAFVAGLTGRSGAEPDAALDLQPGDRLLMLDMSWSEYGEFSPIFKAVRARGGQIVTCVYDLIPALYPAASVSPVPDVYRRWLRAALIQSDGMIAISQTVAQELHRFVLEAGWPYRENLKIGWFHCGSDLDAVAKPAPPRPEIGAALAGADPLFVMVATMEPRKGHVVALDAFERLWSRNIRARLVLFGRKGWHVEWLADRIRSHPRFGVDLFWFEGAGDHELALAYARCRAVLLPSYAEGFGLPLSEAALAGAGAICSDIPVFREVGREGALYFPVNDADALAQTVEDVIEGRAAPDPSRVLRATWGDAGKQIVDVVVDGNWAVTLPSPPQSFARST